MKKILLGAIALAMVAGSPAYARDHNEGQRLEQHHERHDGRHNQSPTIRFGIQLGTPPAYNYDYPNYQYNYNLDNRYRNDNFLYYRYFSRLPSYYPGRCNTYNTVIVRDPYTNRLVCMDRTDYARYVYERRYNRR